MQSHITADFLDSQGFSHNLPSRFFAKVRITDSCWLWTASTNGCGYGRVNVKNTLMQAHRVSWILHFGAIPDGMDVLHNCPGGDNKACVNPAHLWLGDQLANTRDAVSKGKFDNRLGHRGERNACHKLTAEQVRWIRSAYNGKEWNFRTIGEKFGLCENYAWAIVRRVSWKWLK